MFEKKTKDYTPKEKIAFLYYTRKSVGYNYSNIPSRTINLERMLAGLPSFQHEIEQENERIPKVLLLPLIHDKERKERDFDKHIIVQRLMWLRHLGFDIYFCNYYGEYSIANLYTKTISSVTPPSPQELSNHLKIPVDQIAYIDNLAEFYNFMSSPFDEIEAYAPYNTINMDAPLFISTTEIEFLFREHGHAIRHLIHVPKFVKDLSPVALAQISSLESLTLNAMSIAPPISYAQLSSLVLSSTGIDPSVLRCFASPMIKTLHLLQCKNPGLPIRLTNPKALKDLTIKSTKLSLTDLENLLSAPEQLEKLTLDNINIELNQLTLPKACEAKKLRFLNIANNHVDIQWVHALLAHAHESINHINIEECVYTSNQETEALQLPILEQLEILEVCHWSGYMSNSALVQNIIEQAPNLNLVHLKGMADFPSPLHPGKSAKLTRVTLDVTQLSTQSLSALLTHTLEHLQVTSCSNLTAPLTSPIHCPRLKTLQISESFFNIKSIECILENAINIESLELADLDLRSLDILKLPQLNQLKKLNIRRANLSSSIIQALLARAPNLEWLELYHITGLTVAQLKLPQELKRLRKLGIDDCDMNSSFLSSLLSAASESLEQFSKPDTCPNLKTPLTKPQILKKMTLWNRATYRKGVPLHDLNKALIKNDANTAPTKDHETFEAHPKTSPSIGEQLSTNHFNDRPNYTVDADTAPTIQDYHITRQFIGSPYTPHPTKLRLQVFDGFQFNPNSHNNKSPFLLNPLPAPAALSTDLKIPRSTIPLEAEFNNKAKNDSDHQNWYWGRFDMNVSCMWQPLPSVTSEEELIQWYSNAPHDLEFKNEDGFYYVRLKELLTPQKISMELLLRAPDTKPGIDDLPEKLRTLIKGIQGFRKHTLKTQAQTPQEYLEALCKERVGACRHRSIACVHEVRRQFPEIPIHIISNDSHMFVEFKINGHWIPIDLGGYQANLHIQEQHLNTPQNLEEPELLAHEMASMNMGANGQTRTREFFEQARNLSTLTLQHDLSVPENLALDSLDTLTLKNCRLDAPSFHALIHRMPQLKTLVIEHAQITREEFLRLNLSSLQQLDWVELKGSFIPDENALHQLMHTHPNHQNIRWIVESSNLNEVVNDEDANIELQAPARKPIASRYFTSASEKPLAPLDLLQGAKSTLITTDNPFDTAYKMQRLCHYTHRPVFFIDSPEQLQCARSFIKREGNRGIIHKGPGGPLYDFMKQHPDGLVFIDYSRFNGSDMAKVNSLFDDRPNLEGIEWTNPILGFIAPDHAYQGSDFYSRFARKTPLNTPDLPSLTTRLLQDPVSMEGDETIELAGQLYAEVYLKGQWIFKDEQLHFKEGALAKALAQNPKRLILKNPPFGDPEFIRWVRDWDLEHHLTGPQLVFQEGFSWDLAAAICTWAQTETLPQEYEVLNGLTLSQLLGEYGVVDKKLVLKTSLIESWPSSEIPLYLTHSLSDNQWMALVHAAATHHKTLRLYRAPNTHVPHDFPDVFSKEYQWTLPEHTQCHVNMPQALPEDALYIDVSELESADLLSSILAEINQNTHQFVFDEKAGWLPQALQQGQTIVLHGAWSSELAQSMQHFIAQRLRASQVTGTLILVSEHEKTFSCIQPNSINSAQSKATNPSRAVAFDDRLNAVAKALQHSPILQLTGVTGVGKTQFMQTIWQHHHPHCFYGEDNIIQWAQQQPAADEEFITLFIDEANITPRGWTEFQGLFSNPPSVFYKGQPYFLSPRHRVIFSGNPYNYGGERTEPKLFHNPHPVLEFKPIPLAYVLESVALDGTLKAPLLELCQSMEQLYPGQLILTPREVLMMGLLTEQLVKHYPQYTPEDIARYVGYRLLTPHIPQKDWPMFACQSPDLFPKDLGDKFVLTDTLHPAVEALHWHLLLRQARIEHQAPAQGGLGGLVLEGMPGIGKSEVLHRALIAHGLKSGEDFHLIPVSLNFEEKQQRLLKAFHEGKIVIIDEINSSPMLERLLNSLLEGHDLQNKPAEKPGFMLLGTQNPISFHGRRATTLPIKHRMHYIELDEPSPKAIRKILKDKYTMSPKVAADMTQEYLGHKQRDPRLCFRDLMRQAKHWKKEWAKTHQLILRKPVKQTGALCKTAAIANVEHYFAEKLGFTPIPLHKEGQNHPLSIRKVAKGLGSIQGEILEFERWEQTLKRIGYDAQTVSYGQDFSLFLATITQALEQGNLPLIAFALDKASNHPDISPEKPQEQEHAAVITGYDPETDEFTLVHFSAHFKVDAASLFHSNQALLPTRSPEYYAKNAGYPGRFYKQKYKESTAQNPEARQSITPKSGTGFQGKLLIAKSPENLEAFLDMRKKIELGDGPQENESSKSFYLNR